MSFIPTFIEISHLAQKLLIWGRWIIGCTYRHAQGNDLTISPVFSTKNKWLKVETNIVKHRYSAPVYNNHHPCITLMKASEQNFPLRFQRESPSKTPPPLAAIRQHLWHYKCTVKHYNRVRYSAMSFCFHRLYIQLPGIFNSPNTVHQQFCVNN
jgi:hypothetical protein